MQESSFAYFMNPACHKAALAGVLQKQDTPLFAADKTILRDRYTRLHAALAHCWSAHAIAYSFKTNYFAARSGVFQEQGAWAEVVSGREYRMAKALGYSGDQIIFNGPYKTDAQLCQALNDKAVLHINDSEELKRLLRIVEADKTQHDIGLRVGAALTGRQQTRFGFSLENREAAWAIEQVLRSRTLNLAGLHMHLLGDTDDPAYYREACEKLCALIATHIPGYTEGVRYLDLGGGFPAHGPKPRRRTSWNPQPIEVYVETITDVLRRAFPGTKQPTLILEPGRYLVGDGMVFITRVVRASHTDSIQTLTCDGSITMLPLMHYCPPIVQAFSPCFTLKNRTAKASLVYGASCREDDILFDGPLPKVNVGDYLVYYAVGAYNSSLSPDFIFEAPPVIFL